MTDHEHDVADTAPSRMLHVRYSPFDGAAHIVSTATIEAAEAAQNAPYLESFGQLRRSGGIDEFAQRLDQSHGQSAEDYAAAVERSAGRSPDGDDLAARLKALDDVDFEGDDDFPSDDTNFRPQWEIDEEPDDDWRGYEIIATAMRGDVPADVFVEFCEDSYGDSPAFSGHVDSHVKPDRLDAMIAALEARGFTVVQD